VATVNGGGAGLCGLQLGGDGPLFELGELDVSAGQDVRVFSSSGAGVAFKEAVTVAATASLTVQGTFSTVGFDGTVDVAGALVFLGAMQLTDGTGITAPVASGGTVSIHGGVTVEFPDGSTPTISGALPGKVTAILGGKTVGSLAFSESGAMTGTRPGGNWPT
jgi:hypothetical protein